MEILRITLVQTEIAWHDPEKNRKYLLPKLEKLAGRTDLIILPEMFTTGFTLAGEHLAEPMDAERDGTTTHWLRDLARQTGAAVAGSLIIGEGGNLYNRLLWLTPEGTIHYYDKHNLFSFAGEDKIYTPGQELLTVQLKGWRIRPFICYDLRFPQWSSRARGNYDLGIYVANWPAARENHWRTLLLARAIENQIYLAGVNRVGGDGNGLSYSGGSMLLDPLGEVVYECGDAEEIVTRSMSYESLLDYRKNFPMKLS